MHSLSWSPAAMTARGTLRSRGAMSLRLLPCCAAYGAPFGQTTATARHIRCLDAPCGSGSHGHSVTYTARRLQHTFCFTSPQGINQWFKSCTVRQANLFAQSRVTNYLKRVVADDAGAGALGLFTTCRVHTSPPIHQTTLQLPVDVLVDNQVSRCQVEARGFGADARTSRIACCMHAERCLDALGVPLFASAERQEAHAQAASQDGGRFAPRPGDLPQELSSVTLPAPFVVASPLYSVFSPQETPADGAATETPHASSTPGPSHSPPPLPSRRPIVFNHHYGPDPFLHRVEAELGVLREAIASLQTAAMAAQDCEDSRDDGETDKPDDDDPPVLIDPSEIAVLQPEDTDGGNARIRGHSPTRAPRVAVAYNTPSVVSEHRHPGQLPVDESEAGQFDLVEGNGTDWCTDPELPGAACLFDPHATDRIKAYYGTLNQEASNGGLGTFEQSLKITTGEEPTNVRTGRGSWRAVPMQWWTASAPVPGYETALHEGSPVRAIGKATTVERATVLCAMHMELLLGFFGEPIRRHDATAQLQYYDACLCWGRPVAPIPWLPHTAGEVTLPTTATASGITTLPRPLKEWFRADRQRLRHAPLTVIEKLVALNRAVVAQYRQHLLEIDLFDNPRCHQEGYAELLDLSVPCLRDFLRSQQHPYEGAFFVLTFMEGSAYRASLYLPLPARYGVRGGYAVASTPARAKSLAALHAVDTLCCLGVIPLIFEPSAQQHPRWQRLLALRDKLGLTMPPTKAVAATLNPQLRSPPAYRESPGNATSVIPPPDEVWRTMLLDAAWFDVVPDGKDMRLTVPPGVKLPYGDVLSTARHLFVAYTRYIAGWSQDDVVRAVRHYCGPQHHRGRRRRVANTFWGRLPLDESRYGARVAVGRCITRKGAERNFYLHAFRILATLRLVPWMSKDMAALQSSMYGGDAVGASLDASLWKAIAPLVLDPASFDDTADGASLVVDAVITESGTHTDIVDKRSVASPQPIMSYELARSTL